MRTHAITFYCFAAALLVTDSVQADWTALTDPKWVASSSYNSLHSNGSRVVVGSNAKGRSALHVRLAGPLTEYFDPNGATSNPMLGGILVGTMGEAQPLVAIGEEGIQGYIGSLPCGPELCAEASTLTLQPLGHDLEIGGDTLVDGDALVSGELQAQSLEVGTSLSSPQIYAWDVDATVMTAETLYTENALVAGDWWGLNVSVLGDAIVARQEDGKEAPLNLQPDGGAVVVHGGAGMAESEQVRIRDDGRVVIGEPNAQYSGAKLTVQGGIVARSLRVTTNGWPDYVFAEDYELASLDDVADYVAEHKHLPGIPAAAEVESGGLDVGEMQKRLLQKVEELTLHTIRQQREIDRLSALCTESGR